jgi:hypothetical protein
LIKQFYRILARHRDVVKFCQLEWCPDFEEHLQRTAIYSFADKWKKFMPEEEGELIAQR